MAKSEFLNMDLVRHPGSVWQIYDNKLGLCSAGRTVPEALRNMARAIESEEKTGALAKHHEVVAREAAIRREEMKEV